MTRQLRIINNWFLLNKFVVKKVLFNVTIARQMTNVPNCIFCKIISGDVPGEIFYQDDEIVIFKDIKPASDFHFLAVPKQHIPNVNSLTKEHIQLVNKFISCGKQVLSEKGGDPSDVRMGFHLPPFNSISHLHLHVISPTSSMSFMTRLIFKPYSWWFSSVDQILEKLNQSKL